MPPVPRPNVAFASRPLEKAGTFSDFFSSNQSSEAVVVSHTCFPAPKTLVTSFAFRLSELCNFLFKQNSYGGKHTKGLPPPLFFKNIAKSPKLERVIFPLAGVLPSHSPKEYKPISVTPILSKVFERLIAKRFSLSFNDHKCCQPLSLDLGKKNWYL